MARSVNECDITSHILFSYAHLSQPCNPLSMPFNKVDIVERIVCGIALAALSILTLSIAGFIYYAEAVKKMRIYSNPGQTLARMANDIASNPRVTFRRWMKNVRNVM